MVNYMEQAVGKSNETVTACLPYLDVQPRVVARPPINAGSIESRIFHVSAMDLQFCNARRI